MPETSDKNTNFLIGTRIEQMRLGLQKELGNSTKMLLN